MHLALLQTAQEVPVDASEYAQTMFGGGFLLVVLLIAIICIAGLWKVFTKAGQPGWAAIVPIYNAFVLVKVAGRPMWWGLLFIIPVVGIIVWILLSLDLVKRFGKETLFAVGLILLAPIFLTILGFDNSRYTPQGATAG